MSSSEPVSRQTSVPNAFKRLLSKDKDTTERRSEEKYQNQAKVSFYMIRMIYVFNHLLLFSIEKATDEGNSRAFHQQQPQQEDTGRKRVDCGPFE